MIGYGHIQAFCCGPKLESGGQKLERLSVVKQVLVILCQLLHEFVAFLGWLLQIVGQSSVFKDGLSIVCFC